MKGYKLLVSALGCMMVTGGAYAQRPNVLLIYTDDQGTLDAGCFGATDLYTPHMDRIAASGVKFTQFYAAPVSSASRAACLTGQYAAHNGITGIVQADGLASAKETIAERMQMNGYRTACIGKWHLGFNDGCLPNNQGFDYFWGFRRGCIDNYSHYFYWNGPNRHDLWRNEEEIFEYGQFFMDLNVRELKNFMTEEDTDKPFFIYWAVNMPHYPIQPKVKWLDHYSHLPDPRRMYAAFVSTFDEYLGEILSFLDDQGLSENTIIIYQSDNGHSCETRNFGGGGYCGDFRGAKFSLFEGGIRVPAMISWPRHIPAGQTRDQMLMNIDWFPTIMDLCEIDPEGTVIDGKSVMPVVRDPDHPGVHDVLYFDHGNKWAVRERDWKLLYNAMDIFKNDEKSSNKGYFLVNMTNDCIESTNLAEEHPEIVERLLKLRDNRNLFKEGVK